MFFKNTKEESTEVKRLEEVIESMEKAEEEARHDHKREITNLEKDQEVILKRKDAELDVKIAEATAELKTNLATKTAEASDYKKECEILTKAFENLGFDVKDMKEILNKLVDGIVSKNTVQLVK